jgi:aminoglycoside phosphotransferase (APT) family kinase protein
MQNSGRLTSLIDFGDLGLGDPACDLGGALFCVGLGNQDSLVGSYEPVSHATITRARGWAAYFAVRHHEIGGVYTRAAEDFFASLSL